MSYDQICADAVAEVTDLRAKVAHLREVMGGVQRDRDFERTRAEKAEAEVARTRAQVAEEIAVAIGERIAAMPKVDERGWSIDSTVTMAWIPALAREHAEVKP